MLLSLNPPTERIFKAMNCIDTQKVRLAAFLMYEQAQSWWESKERELTETGGVITWDMFHEEMQNKYVFFIIKDRKAAEFVNLEQGTMTVTKYETKFEELSKYTPNTIPTEHKKALKFQLGLNKEIQLRIAPLALETFSKVLKSPLLVEEGLDDDTRVQTPMQ